jgi:hypothetical protein
MPQRLETGRIVWAEVADTNGIRKLRPAVIVTPTDQLASGEPIDVVAVTSRLTDPLPDDHVLSPWHPRGHPRTGLNRRCAAVQNTEIQNNVKNLAVFRDGTRISSRKGQPFAIEILGQPLAEFGKKPPRPVAVGEKDGLATASIQRDQIYEIRIFNHSGREVAVAVSIDGIDLFHFSRDRVVGDKDKERIVHLKEDEALVGRPRFSHFILTDGAGKAQQELTIPGWHYSQEGDDNFRSFLVTAYGKGAHSKAGIAARAGLGTIQVRFLECYPLAENTRPKDGDETGFGPSRKVQTRVVKYGVGAELDSIAVRYTNLPEGK